MKPVSAGLEAIMNLPGFIRADLYTFTLFDGTVFTCGDYPAAYPVLTANGHNYPVSGLKFKRSGTKQTMGLEVDTMTIDVFADPNDSTATINGIPFAAFVRDGGFDGAMFRLDKCFMSIWGDCATNGTLLWFLGRVADAQGGRSMSTLTIKSLPDILNQQMPPDVYQPGCLNTLFDSSCRVVKASFASSGVTTSGSTTTDIHIGTSGAPADGYFTLGTIKFTSGPNNGFIRTIKSYTLGHIIPAVPLPFAPGTGDAFTAYPGCDKTQATCTNKFSNLPNFRGISPFIPVPETAR